MSFLERNIVKLGSYLLPQSIGIRLAKAVLATQGIGWAGPKGGVYTSGEFDFLKRFLANISNPIVFDVGANTGDYTVCCIETNANSVVHCFEPSKSHRERFINNDALVKGISSNKVFLNAFGLSDVEENGVLYKDEEITGLASLTKRNLDYANIDFTIKEDVHLKKGDDYIFKNKIKNIDLLKIDVEGWEMSVLKGMERAFEMKVIKVCQFEFAHGHIERRENFRDFYNFFLKHGYSMGMIKPNGKVNMIDSYNEFLEHYFATNYLAFSK